MAFPTIYAVASFARSNSSLWTTSFGERRSRARTNRVDSQVLHDACISEGNSYLCVKDSAACRESILGACQSWASYMIKYSGIQNNSGTFRSKLELSFSLSEKIHPNLVKSSITVAGYANGYVNISTEYVYGSTTFIVGMPMESFDLGKMSVLLFCLTRFPEYDPEDKAYIDKILEEPNESFPNNEDNADFLSCMTAYAIESRNDYGSYKSSSMNPNGYYGYGEYNNGIAELTKRAVRRNPQKFCEFVRKHHIDFDQIEENMPFSEDLTWRELSEVFLKKEGEDPLSSLEGYKSW